MPLVRFDLIEGRSKEELKQLLDAAHEAMVEAFQVPERDRYQIVHQHPENEMIIEDTGLGFTRTNKMVIVSMTSRKRTEEQKQKFYQFLVRNLKENCGVAQEDVMVSITENGDADWSFGRGQAQFLSGDL
ncbi:tautomerase family protein [Metabacillus sp. GX 13764]|uniref:tautomerase family protein n=1 Tax=Metabacillus kandeliae TaxID=2900151 RepID=UPI001E427AC2|nr:tautomerase family protein [Metabacillus kandeliae]MCD7035639.1 tautomerase family protein [Metabacillus kandeliae]